MDPAHYADGLRLGLVSTEEVQRWVNEQVATDQEPTDTYLELAYTSPSSVHETSVLLNQLAGDYDVYPVLRGWPAR